MYYSETSLASAIWKRLSDIWSYLKKVWYRIINFVNNIVTFFREQRRIELLQEEKDRLAIVIKDRLKNGEYNVVNCIFAQDTGEIVNYKEDALVMQSNELDETTKKNFGNKDMLVLK